jgi:hypothetical protein
MPNEFIAKKGLISNSNVQVTGSLRVTNGITASLQGSSSYAMESLSASYAPGTPSVSASYALSASYAPSTPSLSASVASTSSVAIRNGAFAYAQFTLVGPSMTVNTAYNCAVTRISLGLYGVKFNTPPSSGFYTVGYTGCSGSVALPNPTASLCAPFRQTATDFTMSLSSANAGLVRTDPRSGSVIVFGF